MRQDLDWLQARCDRLLHHAIACHRAVRWVTFVQAHPHAWPKYVKMALARAGSDVRPTRMLFRRTWMRWCTSPTVNNTHSAPHTDELLFGSKPQQVARGHAPTIFSRASKNQRPQDAHEHGHEERRPINQSPSQPINQYQSTTSTTSTNQPVSQSTSQPIYQPNHRLDASRACAVGCVFNSLIATTSCPRLVKVNWSS